MEFYGPANEGEKLGAVPLNWPRSIIWVKDMLISRCTVWVNDGMLICGILAKNDQTLSVGELVL